MTGSELREWRKNIGLSQTQLADQLHIPQNTISRWECSKNRIRHPVLLMSAIKLIEERLRLEQASVPEVKVWVECQKSYFALEDVESVYGYAPIKKEKNVAGDVLLFICPICRKKHAGSLVSP